MVLHCMIKPETNLASVVTQLAIVVRLNLTMYRLRDHRDRNGMAIQTEHVKRARKRLTTPIDEYVEDLTELLWSESSKDPVAKRHNRDFLDWAIHNRTATPPRPSPTRRAHEQSAAPPS